ncbi:hypothetical protein K0M31_009446, partial [Melipona bicolor]
MTVFVGKVRRYDRDVYFLSLRYTNIHAHEIPLLLSLQTIVVFSFRFGYNKCPGWKIKFSRQAATAKYRIPPPIVNCKVCLSGNVRGDDGDSGGINGAIEWKRRLLVQPDETSAQKASFKLKFDRDGAGGGLPDKFILSVLLIVVLDSPCSLKEVIAKRSSSCKCSRRECEDNGGLKDEEKGRMWRMKRDTDTRVWRKRKGGKSFISALLIPIPGS